MSLLPQFVIGAAASGSGKTTFTLGLLRALARRGVAVQPFKCGPDYIDTRYHAEASGRESVNLDLFLSSEAHVRSLWSRYGAGADVLAAEGAMGLFDGYEAWRGSAADVARVLGVPVVLVVDARSSAYSAAPLLYGYRRFRPDVEIAGVVFNRVASASHLRSLEEAARDAGVRPLGCVKRDAALEIPSRHLGLTLDERFRFGELVDRAADRVAEGVDLGALLDAAARPFEADGRPAPRRGGLRIAVARDEAFNFVYRENLARLAELGRVEFFSPLADSALPPCDLLYLPGGYPEFRLGELAANEPMRRAVREYAEAGGRVWAECGGMMYLGESVADADGRAWPMCGVLPLRSTMEGMRLHLGYRRVEVDGREWRGHEFHYSSAECALPSSARQYAARGAEVDTPFYKYRNVRASYTHLYWGESDPLDLFR